MIADNYQTFIDQLIIANQKYPNLRIKEVGGIQILKGLLDIPDDNDEVIKSYSIEIHFSKCFPFCFPILFEAGEDIPNEADWHKYEDGSCCITIPPNERLICKDGISVLHFIENHAIPYLANQLLRKTNGYYKNGEYAHGNAGFIQFYSSLFKTADPKKWYEYMSMAFLHQPVKILRNQPCFCGSKLKYKKCHDMVFYQMQIIGYEQIRNDIEKLTQ